MLVVERRQCSFAGGRWRRVYVDGVASLAAEEEDMMVVRHFNELFGTSLIDSPQHHKDLLDPHPPYLPAFLLALEIKIDTRTEMEMPLRLRVWITVGLPRMVVRGRRHGNQKIVGMAGEIRYLTTCAHEHT